jgi:hypothetical protein
MGTKLTQQTKSNRDDGSYASGDLYEKHPTKNSVWRYVGRGDDVIVMVRSLCLPLLAANRSPTARRHLQVQLNHCCEHLPNLRTPSSSDRIDLNSVSYFSPVPKPLSNRSLPQSHHSSIRPTSHHLPSLISLPTCAYLSKPNVHRNCRKAVKAQYSGGSPMKSTRRRLTVCTMKHHRTTALV